MHGSEAVVAGTIDMDRNRQAGVALETRSEVELLKDELDRYRRIFDSANMIVGHELIKPLTSISGYVELLENRFEESCDEDEKRYFEKVRESIAKLQELVEAFLMLLRLESAGEHAGVFQRIDLRELVEGLRPKEGSGRMRLRNAVGPDMSTIIVQKKQLEVVLDNLISNALKHSGDNEPVTVSARVIKDRRGISGEEVLIVRVQDEGVGIPEHELAEIFHPFYRGDSDSRAGGLGLGLALVKNIIDLMGGEVSVSSKPGEGTDVTFSVPLKGREQKPIRQSEHGL